MFASLFCSIALFAAVTAPMDGVVTALDYHLGYLGDAFILCNGTDYQRVINVSKCSVAPGDRVHLECESRLTDGIETPFAIKLEKTGRGEIPEPDSATAADILSGRFIYHTVRITGMAIDLFPDPIDPNWSFLLLNSNGDSMYIGFRTGDNNPVKPPKDAVGSEIEVTGIAAYHIGKRHFFNYTVICTDSSNARILRRPDDDPFLAPEIRIGITGDTPYSCAAFKHRTAKGVVIAEYEPDRRFFVRTEVGSTMTISLDDNINWPGIGASVLVSGFPSTDLFNIFLSHAQFKYIPDLAIVPESPAAIPISSLHTNRSGTVCLQPEYHGRLISVKGRVTYLSNDQPTLDADGFSIRLDFGRNADPAESPEPDSIINATGIAVMDSELWRPDAPFARIHGFRLITRRPSDIVIISRPPWWTSARLLTLILTLLAIIIILAIWTRVLSRILNRRNRDLIREQIARAVSDFRTDERTRLSVELHDTLSQNLSGISCQVSAALRLLSKSPETASSILVDAERMFKSCRTELKNCLFDLRSNILDEKDFSKAIRRCLENTANAADLSIRFNIPRSRLKDSTAHTILSIIRELVSNAVLHGNARHIRIAGALDKDAIRFSVTDDGSGFDPATAPGLAQGHFGLSGIEDRVHRIGGDFSITRNPVCGMHAKVQLNLPCHEQD